MLDFLNKIMGKEKNPNRETPEQKKQREALEKREYEVAINVIKKLKNTYGGKPIEELRHAYDNLLPYIMGQKNHDQYQEIYINVLAKLLSYYLHNPNKELTENARRVIEEYAIKLLLDKSFEKKNYNFMMNYLDTLDRYNFILEENNNNH
jgi:hypothetical protein